METTHITESASKSEIKSLPVSRKKYIAIYNDAGEPVTTI